MNATLKSLIAEFSSEKSFSKASPSPASIAQCEEELGIILSNQYKEFLVLYGQGGFNGFYVLGFNKAGKPAFVRETIEHREYGLPNQLVAIENCDEWLYCENSANGSIVSWSPDGEILDAYDDFDSYLLDRMNDAIENL